MEPNRSLAQTDEVVLHICYGGVDYSMFERNIKVYEFKTETASPLTLSNGATFQFRCTDAR